MKKFALFAVVALAACSQNNQQASVAGLESGLTAADIVALQYTSQPPCPVASGVCADPAVKQKIKADAQTAYTAVKAAEVSAASGATVDLTAASAALAAFQADLAANVKGAQ